MARELRKHPLLDRTDMESERRPSDLMLWIGQKDVEFQDRQDELRRVLSHEDYCKAEDDLFQHRLAKIFMEEIRPLGLFAIRKFRYRDGIIIKPCIGNQNYDAIVRDTLIGRIIHIETTTTLDGQKTRIQIEHMRKYGSAPVFNEIKYTGTANKGYVIEETHPIAIDRDDIHYIEFARIKNRFMAKKRKNYPRDTWLLITFDDYIGFTSHRDMEKLRAFATREISPDAERFAKLVLMGWSGNNWMELDRT